MHENEFFVSYGRSSIIYDDGYDDESYYEDYDDGDNENIYHQYDLYQFKQQPLYHQSIYVSITPSTTNSSPFSSTMGHLPK